MIRPLCVALLCLSFVTFSVVTTVGADENSGSFSFVSPEDEAKAKVFKSPRYIPGRLIVKMKGSVEACLDDLWARGETLASATGSDGLDELNRHYEMRRIRPLRAADAALPSLSARRQRQAERRARLTALRPAQDLPDFSMAPCRRLGA